MSTKVFPETYSESDFFDKIFLTDARDVRKDDETMNTPDLNKTAEDSDIVRGFFERDESALSEVSRKYKGYCTSIARNILGNEQAAEECVNDTLMRLWESIPPARPDYLPAFIGKIARNIALNIVRRENSLKRGGGEIDAILDEAAEMISCGDSVEVTVQRHEIISAINDWLGTLPEKKRAVFVLRYWHCRSTSDVARCVGMSQANVENVLKRGRQKLVEYMNKRGF